MGLTCNSVRDSLVVIHSTIAERRSGSSANAKSATSPTRAAPIRETRALRGYRPPRRALSADSSAVLPVARRAAACRDGSSLCTTDRKNELVRPLSCQLLP